jgi:hypothetical protein
MRREWRTVLASRWATTLLALWSWLLLSNHCALATLSPSTESAPAMSECPMHAAPAKKKPAAKIPCCKEVRATVAKCLQVSPVAARLIGLREYAAEILRERSNVTIEIQSLDTGPPGSFSFAESVLQESMLSHAPPVS